MGGIPHVAVFRCDLSDIFSGFVKCLLFHIAILPISLRFLEYNQKKTLGTYNDNMGKLQKKPSYDVGKLQGML